MISNIKKNLYFSKLEILFTMGLKSKKIVPFDEEFYNKLNNKYFNGIPVSFHIKYLRPDKYMGLGKCYDRSLFMFLCIENAVLVRADLKDLELNYGKDHAGHGWIEIDNYVYDPTHLMRFDKDLYYKMFGVSNVSKCNKDDYCSTKENKELYERFNNTKLEDYKPYGKRRTELIMSISLVYNIAKLKDDKEFIEKLDEYLNLIEYDEEEIEREIDEKLYSLKK